MEDCALRPECLQQHELHIVNTFVKPVACYGMEGWHGLGPGKTLLGWRPLWRMLRQVPGHRKGGQNLCRSALLQADSGVELCGCHGRPAPIPAQSERWRAEHCCYVCCAGNVKAATLTTRALAEQTWWTSTPDPQAQG
jgi:hypothetical protein